MKIDFRGDIEMPDDVKSLDSELRAIQYEERPSFGPELEAELAREWERVRHENPRLVRARHLAAAAVLVLLLAGAGVPSARASLVRLIGSFQEPVEEQVTEPGPAVGRTVVTRPVEPANPLLEPPVEEVATRRLVPIEAPLNFAGANPTAWPESTVPEIADRARSEALIRRHYPAELQRLGVAGSVRLRLWVKEDGTVDNVQLAEGAGIPGLDRAAMSDIGPSLRFKPATRRGETVGTWVEFDVRFELVPASDAAGGADGQDAFPSVDLVVAPDIDLLDLAAIPEWRDEITLVAPIQAEAEELLAAAMDPVAVVELGPIGSILAGEPPAGAAPTQWRASVGGALEDAMVRASDNPAPPLALARIRRKQGLRTEAGVLFERGLQRALRSGDAVSPNLIAELHYERALLLKDAWRAERRVGSLPASLLDGAECRQASAVDAAGGEDAAVRHLIAWNYLCPTELGGLLDSGFAVRGSGGEDRRAAMLEWFGAAVEANPGHVGANVEVLMSLASEGRWSEVLQGANDFVRASVGHPYGLLVGGIALQRLSRSDEAERQFELALRGLPESEARALTELTLVLGDDLLEEYLGSSGAERADWERRFWAPLDPVMTTTVNERAVEHLARSAYAYLNFGSATSDPAEVWIRYGGPDVVRVFGDGSGVRTEFWDYGGPGPDVTFTRAGSAVEANLTSEGRAYLDDLRDVFPHRYGVASRRVYTLPGQVSRFMSVQPGAMDFEVHTRVPRVLATGVGDTLDLGVFFVGPEGDRTEITTRRVRAEEVPISLRIPVASDTGSLVVEIFNQRTGQAAALREPVEPMRDFDGSSISDLMVIAPADSPDPDELVRGADWVEALVFDQPLAMDVVGAYFELYMDVSDVPRYYLRAEVVDVGSGEVLSVPTRPAGEDGFQDVWDRRPADRGATREYVTVALTDVEPGRHTLRVIVDVPERGARLIAEQNIDRRED